MNDNLPESERWVPVKRRPFDRINEGLEEALAIVRGEAEPASVYPPGAELFAKSAKNSPALDRARREAEAVIAKAFSPAREHWLKP